MEPVVPQFDEVSTSQHQWNCSPEVDKDGDDFPDNLDVEGPIDGSNCNLFGLNISNLKLSGAHLSGSGLFAADMSNTVLSGENLSYATL